MKILKKIFPFAFFLVLAQFLPSSAYGADFIYKFKEDVVMPLSVDDNSDYLAFGMYTTDDEEMLERLNEMGLLEFYEPNGIVYLCEDTNDPYYTDGNTGQYTYEYRLTNALGAVNNDTYDAKGVRIGIIDTGIADRHPDIDYSKIVARRNVISGTDSATDTIGHGTGVAGIIAASTNNGIGVSSLAHGAELVIIKVFPDGGKTTNVEHIVSGLKYAIDQHCDVVNMSVGTPLVSEALKAAAMNADEQGIIVVAASGNHDSTVPNDLTKDSRYLYPAAYESTISVSAVNADGEPTSFSYHNDMVDVAACGETVWLLGSKANPEEGYRRSDGTSFSCPFVAATAALMKQINPKLTRAQFLEYIKETSTDKGAEGRDTFYGYGIINVGKMLDAALGINIKVSPLFHDRDGNFDVQTTVINNSFDTYTVKNIWFMDTGNGQTNRKTENIVLPPRSSRDLSYLGYGTISQMLWFGSSMQPITSKQEIVVQLDFGETEDENIGEDYEPIDPDTPDVPDIPDSGNEDVDYGYDPI